MFILLMEELARARDRARLSEARARRLVSAPHTAADLRPRAYQEEPAVGAFRRMTGRRLIEFGAWLAGTSTPAHVGHRHLGQPA